MTSKPVPPKRSDAPSAALMPEDEFKRRLDELDDTIDDLVASLDAAAPDTHQAVYQEIERIHGEIAALKARARLARRDLH